MKIIVKSVICLFVVSSTSLAAELPKNPTALALLRGVESARAKYDNLRVELSMEFADRTEQCTVPCLIEQAGQKRRFEQFVGSCSRVGIVTLINGLEVRSYSRKKNADLEIYDIARSGGLRGNFAFDPRILGLDEITPTADIGLGRLLWIETSDQVDLVGREAMKGTPTWHVQAKWGETTSDFWIEEPLFRVHKRVLKAGDIRVEIDSEFNPKDKISPFPLRVEVTREDGKEWKQVVETVNSFEVNKPIPAERFTEKSIDMPVNTMFNDYRINRIVGYWDGQGLSKDPVYSGQKASAPPVLTPAGKWRLVFIGINAVAVFTLLLFLGWRHWRRKPAQAK